VGDHNIPHSRLGMPNVILLLKIKNSLLLHELNLASTVNAVIRFDRPEIISSSSYDKYGSRREAL
jgi:hypothetical protein